MILGSPKRVIVDKAKELGIDLIVVGSHGKTLAMDRVRFSDTLGSVSNYIVSKANCDVLVVKPREV